MTQSLVTSNEALRLAISLNSSRDAASLEANLRQVLDVVLGVSELSIYAVEYRSEQRRCRTAEQANIKQSLLHDTSQPAITLQLSRSPDAVAALLQNEPIRGKIKNGNYRIFYPVKGEFTRQKLAVIVAKTLNKEHIQFIDHFMNIYINHLNILSLSERDALTGLKNRQAFNVTLNKMIQQQKNDQGEAKHFCFALFDIDHFKNINDNYGHLFGDEVLLSLSNIMQSAFRFEDYLFRYGGEEFAVILSNLQLQQATKVLNRFRHTLHDNLFPQVETVTMSAGLVQYKPGINEMELMQKADQALYWAKQHGRDQVAVYEELISQNKIQQKDIVEHQVEIYHDDFETGGNYRELKVK